MIFLWWRSLAPVDRDAIVIGAIIGATVGLCGKTFDVSVIRLVQAAMIAVALGAIVAAVRERQRRRMRP